MRKPLALGTAVAGGLGIVLVALGAALGAGADEQPVVYSVSLAGLAADGNPASQATPFSAPAGQVVAARVSCRRDSDGAVRVVGLVANGLDRPAAGVQLLADLTAKGEPVASAPGHALLQSISGGRLSPFEIVFPAPVADFDACRVAVTQYITEGAMPQIPYGLEVSLGLPRVDGPGAIRVPGTVRNRSAQGWRFVQVYVVLTDDAGLVRYVDAGDAKPGEISSGLQSTFEVAFPADLQLTSFGMQGFAWAEPPGPTPTPLPTRTPTGPR